MRNSREQILRTLHGSELALTPANIAYNIGLSRTYIRKECQHLWKQDLLNRDADESRPFYSICERGGAALEQGEVDITHVYVGQRSDSEQEVIVEPEGKELQMFDSSLNTTYSWGSDSDDSNCFALAQDIIRREFHDITGSQLDAVTFDFYQDVIAELDDEFELSEAEIRRWVAEQIEEPDLAERTRG